MKSWAWGAVVLSLAALTACSKGGTTGTGSGGSGGGSGGGTTGTQTTGTQTTGTQTTGSMTTGTMSTGANMTSTGTGMAGCGSLQWSMDMTCQDCMTNACCNELAACDTGTPCGALLDCATACNGDKTCLMGCGTDHMDGQADLQALQSCSDTSCMMECNAGAICMSGLSKPNSPDCAACDGMNCCQEWTDCANDANCQACVTGNAAGMNCATDAKANAAKSCEQMKCGDKCASGICTTGLTTSKPACDTCLTTNCCMQFQTCVDDATCKACLLNPQGAGCSTNMLLTAASMCESTSCKTQCM